MKELLAKTDSSLIALSDTKKLIRSNTINRRIHADMGLVRSAYAYANTSITGDIDGIQNYQHELMSGITAWEERDRRVIHYFGYRLAPSQYSVYNYNECLATMVAVRFDFPWWIGGHTLSHPRLYLKGPGCLWRNSSNTLGEFSWTGALRIRFSTGELADPITSFSSPTVDVPSSTLTAESLATSATMSTFSFFDWGETDWEHKLPAFEHPIPWMYLSWTGPINQSLLSMIATRSVWVQLVWTQDYMHPALFHIACASLSGVSLSVHVD